MCATDITYVWTPEGWLYLAVVMDLFSRQTVGWAINRRMKAQPVLDALAMAYWKRRPSAGPLHHSDRGSHACGQYRNQPESYQMITGRSRKGDCRDNAPTERFFRSLKPECLAYCRFAFRAAAEMEILEHVTFYNAYRLHSTTGCMSPMEFKKKYLLKAA